MKRNTFWGLILILLAAYLVISNVVNPIIPVFTVIATVVLALIIFDGIKKRSIGEIVIALGILYLVYDEYLPFPKVSTWIVILATILLASGLSMIIKPKNRHIEVNGNLDNISRQEEYTNGNVQHSETVFTDGSNGNYDGECLHFENTFSSASKYINSTCLRELHGENSFGSLNIYMDNAILAPEGAFAHIENSFGETKVYLPARCQVRAKESTGLGSINYVGTSSGNSNDPVLNLDLEVSFGSIVVYYK